jgi:diacylglycerol kinase
MFKKVLNSFKFALNGLYVTWKEEFNFRIEVVVAVVVIFSIFYFQFSFVESALCFVAVIIVLSAEIVNTAIEDLSDMVEPNQNPLIGKIKDTMAGFVLVSSFGAFIIGCLVFYNHFLL